MLCPAWPVGHAWASLKLADWSQENISSLTDPEAVFAPNNIGLHPSTGEPGKN
jgi:hypothetical protein